MNKPVLLALCTVLVIGLLVGYALTPKTEPGAIAPKVRVGVIKALGTISPYVANELGYFKEAGLDVELIDFPDGPTLMEAFVSGQIDLTYGGIAPTAIWRSQGVKIKVVAATNSGGHLVLVRDDTGIETLDQLAHKTVAAPKTGSVTDTLFRGLVLNRLTGLDPEKDMRLVVGMAPADMPAALLLTKEVQAIVTWEPFSAECLQNHQNVSVLFNFSDYWKQEYGRSYPVNVISASEEFIENRTDSLKQFLEAHRKTQRVILEAAPQTDELIAKLCGLAPQTIKSARPNLDFTWQVNIDDCMTILEYAKELGYIDTVPPAAQLFDLRFESDS